MKNSHLVAVLAIVVAWTGLSAGLAVAQTAPYRPAPAAPPIALVDINLIFKSHPRFKEQMQQLKAEADAAQAGWKKESEEINKMVETLRTFKPGSPNYSNLEADVVRRQSDFNARMQLSKKDFYHREAKIHYNIYQEISQEVQYYCQQYGIPVAMNVNSTKINVESPEDVLRGIGERVVYYHKDLDITPTIMRRFVRDTPPSGGISDPRGMNIYGPARPK